MANPIASSVGSSAKTLAQQIAKQMAQEPLEILKNAREQTTGEELAGQIDKSPFGSPPKQTEDQQKALHEQMSQQDKMKSTRLIEALNRELEDIHKQTIFKDLQERIMNGEIVPLEEYTELSVEQKQVLKAQMEAVKNQRAMQAANQSVGVPSTSSKPSRRFGAGQKQQAQKEQTRTEKPVNNSQ